MSSALDAEAGDPYYTDSLPGDYHDIAKMAPFQNAISKAAGESWYEGLIGYGITRAIDNRFGPTNIAGNTYGGSYQGANGRTYGNNGSRPAVPVNGMQQPVAGIPMWALLAGAGIVAFLALR